MKILKIIGWVLLSILIAYSAEILVQYLYFEVFPERFSYIERCFFLFVVFTFASYFQKFPYMLVGSLTMCIQIITMTYFGGGGYKLFFFDALVIISATFTAINLKRKNYKLLFLSILLASISLFLGYKFISTPSYSTDRDTNQNLITKNATLLENMNLRNTVFSKDTVYLINFTQTICLPCRQKEISLISLAKNFKNKAVKVVNIYFAQERKYDPSVFEKNIVYLFDRNEKLSKALNIIGAPSEFILNKKGITKRTMVGYGKESESNYEEQTKELITQLLNEK